jgi:hypothetical protein
MGGRDDRLAVPRALDDGAGAPESAGSGLGAAAAAQRPAARPAGLADALHGAPALLAALAAAVDTTPVNPSRRWVDRPSSHRPSLALRRVSKACCDAVDVAATRITLAFDRARQQADAAAGAEARLSRMERRLAKVPRLEELACSGPSNVELGRLLAGPVAAGVQRLDVRWCTSSPGQLHLPSLQVRNSGRSGQGNAGPRVPNEPPTRPPAHPPTRPPAHPPRC